VPLNVITKDRWTELVLDAPPRNVLDREMLADLNAALDELGGRNVQNVQNAPLLLLRSEGRHFSTGYSIADIPEEIFHRDPVVRAANAFEQVMHKLTNYPSPVVAAIQGDAWGGAVELLACTDLRVAARRARLGVPSVRLGLVYSHTGLRRLIRQFGASLVRELLLVGEPIGADRAFQAGFLHRIVPKDELTAAAEDLLTRLTRGGPQALRGTRRVLNLLDEAETLPEQMLAEIARLRHESWSGEEFALARQSFLEKKPSPFGGV
jgi:enoyl-CoA hydratase/carnithine racemase